MRLKSRIIAFGNTKLKYKDFMVHTDGILLPNWERTTFHCREENLAYGISEVKRKIDNNSKSEVAKLQKIISKIEILDLGYVRESSVIHCRDESII